MYIRWAPESKEAEPMHIVTQWPNLSHINPNKGAKNAAIKKTVEVIWPACT